MVNNEDDGGVSLLFFMCGLTVLVILSCITFVSYGIKSREQELNDYYAAPLTQEEIDESWQKFQQREAIRKSSIKEKRDKHAGD